MLNLGLWASGSAIVSAKGPFGETPTASTVCALCIDRVLFHDWPDDDKYALIPLLDHSHRSAGTKYGGPFKTRSGVHMIGDEPHCGFGLITYVCSQFVDCNYCVV